MRKLPEKVRDLLLGGHRVWVATVGEDGWPNVAIKGSGALLDDEHLYFADLFSKKTRANLLRDPRVAVGIYDPENRVAVQVKGRAQMIESGELFDRIATQVMDLRQGLPPVQYVVQIEVEAVYDMTAGPHAGARIE